MKKVHRLVVVKSGKKSKSKRLPLEKRLALQDAAGKLILISLFAGCGGSSKGYELAGLRELLAVEWDKNARDCFKLNFPDIPAEGWDISKLAGKEILDHLGIRPGELDVFDASPPCQGLSISNITRTIDDDRNFLYLKTINLIGEVQPKTFVIENVSGLIKGKMKSFFNQVVDRLGELNYTCEYQVLNANHHRVPQARERCYIIGIRNDIVKKFGPRPLFPAPDHKTSKRMRICDVLPEIKAFSPGQFQDKIHPATKPMCTITKTASAWVYGQDGVRRRPTIDELLVLSSFPKDFKLIGSFLKQWARIGNAVPPNLARAIGENIRDKVLTQEVLEYSKTEEALNYAKRQGNKVIPLFLEPEKVQTKKAA